MKITIIAGARPNFIKIAPLVHALRAAKENGKPLDYRLIYTGSSTDPGFDHTLFNDLAITIPDAFLGIDSSDFFERMAGIMVTFARELEAHPADLVLVIDDTTPTMACTLVAKKKNIRVAHLIAGTRSFNLDTPKEINRLITDGLSDYFFTASMNANRNLNQTGVQQARVYFVGNILIDALRHSLPRFACPEALQTLGLQDKPYLLLTLNRHALLQDEKRLYALLDVLVSESNDLPIVAPVRNYVSEHLKQFDILKGKIHLLPSMSYLHFGYLESHAVGIVTDSGNVAEEATFLNIPCITLNDYAEHPETVSLGTNVLVGNDAQALAQALQTLRNGEWKTGVLPERWDGHTAERIVQILSELEV